MQEQMRRQPDLTLLELQQRLEQVQQLHLSMGWIWILLRRWGLRHKKNRFARRSKTGARLSGVARRGGSK
jgi:transposase